MKNLLVLNSPDKCKPTVRFVNIYLKDLTIGDLLGHERKTLEDARAGVLNGQHGIILRVERTSDGDFRIEKAEEF